MPLPIGRFIVESQIKSTLVLERGIPANLSDYIEIGSFLTGSGGHTLFVAVKTTGAEDIYKQYGLSLNLNHTGGYWFRMLPLDETLSTTEGFDLDVKTDGVTAYIRIRRTLGSGTLTAQVVVQNLGMEDSNFTETASTGASGVVTGELASIPYGTASTDHNQLANRGVYTHAEIDAHINAATPHSGHENKSNKGAPSGYAGLDSSGKVPTSSLYVGSTEGTVCSGNDVRLAGGMPPGPHKTTHQAGGTDELDLGNVPGVIPQARSHGSVDTDMGVGSIHHTLGTNPGQAAAGNHLHTGVYAPSAEGVTNGNSHDHAGGDGGTIDHGSLANAGTVGHGDIDSHVTGSAPHSGHEKLVNKDQPNGYPGLDNAGKIDGSQILFGSIASTVCEGNDPRLSEARPPQAHASTHSANDADPVSLANLAGNLNQDRTHDSVDTDGSASALHHTLGTSATQAAAGNHAHAGVYAPVANGVTNGDSHDHSGGDGGQISHASLSDIGSNSHATVDSHLSAEAPHSGHETIANKNQTNGYAGLDGSGNIYGSAIPYGTQAGTACQGDDSRLSNARTPTAHVSSHQSGGSDAINLANIDGTISQAKTHDFADTDSAPTAIHHTLGTGAGQAAAGDHSHIAAYDLRYAAITSGVTGGDFHDHSGGDGGTIDHATLSNIGSNSHATIDTHLGASAPHSGHEVTLNKGVPGGYAGLDGSGKLSSTVYTFGQTSGAICEGNDPRLTDERPPVNHASTHGMLGADPLTLEDLDGTLAQSRTHDSADTDTAPTALHHTLGTGANQAAAGNHGHAMSDISGLATEFGNYVPLTQKAAANGVATLGNDAKIPESQLPDSITGQVEYKGTWDANADSPTLPAAGSANKGWYYIVNVAGAWGGYTFDIGDWVISSGIAWNKVDNADAVITVFGRLGAVVANAGDYNASQITNTPYGSISSTTVQNAINELDGEKQPLDATLTNLATLSSSANQVIVATGVDQYTSALLTSASFNSAYIDGATGTASLRTLGTGAQQAASGDHLHDGRYSQLGHGHTQSESHGSADTDTAATAIHHTLGTGQFQAAAGNHTHGGGDITSAVANATNAGYATSAGNADTLDGQHAGAFAASSHTHSGSDILSSVASADYATTAGSATSAGNADTVDSVHASSFARVDAPSSVGIAVTATGNNTPAPSAYSNGLYPVDFYNSPDAPSQFLTGLTVMNGVGGNGMQLVANWNGELGMPPGLYLRTKDDTGATWGAWAKVWIESNDGSGSGLDADTLDGSHASSFAAASHQHAGGDITSAVANANYATSAGNADTLDGNHSTAFAAASHQHAGGDITSAVANATNAGYAASAGNADTLDGLHSGSFAAASHQHAGGDITSAVATANYATSAGNADTLDGLHSGSFAAASHQHAGGDITSAVANAANADTLDGLHSGSFAAASHTHGGGDITSTVANASYATSAGNADTVDGYHAGSFVLATSSARPGVIRLYRNDDDSGYNVQTNWTGSYWRLSGYDPSNNFHAGCSVSHADAAGNADTVDGIHGTSFMRNDTSNITSSVNQFTSTGDIANSSNHPLQPYCTGANAAMMSFHRASQYAVNFGLDTDNQLKVGGWSMGAVSYPILHSGNYNSYAPTLTGGGASGTWSINVTGSAGSASTAGYATSATYASYNSAVGTSNDWVTSFQNTPAHTNGFMEMSANGPAGSWWFMENFRHSNSSNYWGTQLAWGWEDNANQLYQRNISANSFSGWVKYLNTGNTNVTTSIVGNAVVQRDGSGYIYANYVNITADYPGNAPAYLCGQNGDGWTRWYSPSNVTAGAATTAYKIRTSAPGSPTDGDIWMV